VIRVANTTPNPRDMAMGMRNLACREVSKIMGASPPNVVNVVRMIGRKRCKPEACMASRGVMPVRRLRLAKSISIRESFTTTPDRATTPNMLKMLRLYPMIRCPITAPTIPNGIAIMIIKGCM